MNLSFRPLGKKIVDIFDANTQADQAKRIAVGQPRYYQQQKPGAPSNIGRMATNMIGDGVVKPVIRTSIAFNQGAGNLGRLAAGGKTQNAEQYFNGRMNPLVKGTGYTGTKQQIAGDAITNVANVAFPGSSKIVKGAFQSVAPKVVPQVINRAVANAGVGAVTGGVSNVGQALSNEQIHSWSDVANAAKTGAQVGAVLGGAGTLALPVVNAGAKAAKDTVKAAGDSPVVKGLTQQRIPLDHQALLKDYSDVIAGASKQSPGDQSITINAGNRLARQYGIDVNAPPATQLENINAVLDTLGKPRVTPLGQSGHVKLGSTSSKQGTKVQAGKQEPLAETQQNLSDSSTNTTKINEQYKAQQDLEQSKYETPTWKKSRDLIGSSLWDPRNVEQRLDNAEFSYQKSTGNTKPGQVEQMPDESLATQRGRIQNPHRAAEVRNKEKFTTDSGNEYSVNDLIKHYGKEDGQKARDFENYRIFKDELNRIALGAKNTLGTDDIEMAKFVTAYEKANPLALEHNSALRQASLKALQEKRNARIDDPELLEKANQLEHYNPRAKVSPDELVKPKMSGGVRSGAKKTVGRSESSGGATRSPLSLFRDKNAELERSLAEQRYGMELRKRTNGGRVPGAKEIVNAETVIAHKQLIKQASDIKEQVTILKRARNQINKAKDKTSSSAVKAQKQAKAAEDKVVSQMKTILQKAKGDKENIYNDLVSRDPRYDTELASLKASNAKLTNLTTKERAEQFKYDKAQLDAKYPKPGVFSRQDLLDLADSLSRDENVTKVNGARQVKRKLSDSLNSQADDLKAMLRQAREDINSYEELQKQTNADVTGTVQNKDRGTQTVQYRLDGETGQIEITNDLAVSLSKQDEMMQRTLAERGLRSVSNLQKLTWTGALQPAFKIWNVLVKNPILQFINADGLSGVRPEVIASIARQVFRTKKMQQFKSDMLSRNMAYENAFQTRNIVTEQADDIARRANLGTWAEGVMTNPLRSLGDVWKGINAAMSSVDNAQRYAVAYGAYKRAKGLGYSEKEALDMGAAAPGKVFGDFDRVTRLAQDMEILVPYSGATQAGTRALIRANKTKPISTAAKEAVVLGGMAAMTAYSMGQAKEYYDEMIASNKRYAIDNNWIIAIPGVKPERNSKGEWSGIITIPMLPDIRPANRAVWNSLYNESNGDGVDGKMIASEMFNQLTGDMANAVYDQERTNHKENILNGVLPGSPALNLGKTLAGVNTRTGEPLANEFTASKPRIEQKNKNTSPGAINISKATGGVMTPLQVDQLLSQIGTAGDVVQAEDSAKNTYLTSFTKPLKPATGQSDKAKKAQGFYEDVKTVGSTLKNEDDFRVYQSLIAKNSVKTATDSAARAKELLARPEVLRAMKDLSTREAKRGGNADPFFTLSNEQQKKVLLYRSSHDLNSAKQAYDKDGNPLFTSLGLDEKWYADYKKQEDSYFDKVTNGKATVALTYSGAKRPDDTAIKPVEEAYYKLPKGTGERSAYLQAHPELLEFWAKGNEFTNAERIALGLDVNTTDKTGGSGSSGYGYGSGDGKKSNPSANPYKYSVSLNAGGSPSKAKVSANKVSFKGTKAYSGGTSKPKVSIKKSKV